MAAAAAIAVVAGAGVGVALTQRGDEPARTDTTDTTGSCTTTDSSTTSLPPPASSSTTVAPPSTSTSPAPATVVRHGNSTRAVVALTFDAGSDAGATALILDLLADRGVIATFGLTGCWVERYPDLSRRIVAEGHAVINHTQDHLSFTGYSTDTASLPADERVRQLREAEEVIRSRTGVSPRPWFRPPYGDYDDSVLVDVGAAGYDYVIMWSIDSLGWKGLAPSEVAARTVAALEPGAIVLMHVGAASTDVDALPAVLDALQQRGLDPVTIADLVSGS